MDEGGEKEIERMMMRMRLVSKHPSEEKESPAGSKFRATYDALKKSFAYDPQPKTDADWMELSFVHWEDYMHVLRNDPLLERAFPGTGEKARSSEQPGDLEWKRMFEWLNDREERLLDPERHHASIQRLVAEIDPGIKSQPFTHVIPIGCTSRYAVIAARVDRLAIDEAPDQSVLKDMKHTEYRLYRLDLAEADVKTEFMRSSGADAPSDKLDNTSLQRKVSSHFEVPVYEVSPCWRLVPNTRMRSEPCLSAIGTKRGIVAIVCQEKPTSALVFDVHRRSDSEGRIGRIGTVHIPAGIPDVMAVNDSFLAVAYEESEAYIRGEDTVKPQTIPPHVQLYGISARLRLAKNGTCVPAWMFEKMVEAGEWRDEDTPARTSTELLNEEVASIAPAHYFASRGTAVKGQVAIDRVSCLSFHENYDNILYVGTPDGGIEMVQIEGAHASEDGARSGLRKIQVRIEPQKERIYLGPSPKEEMALLKEKTTDMDEKETERTVREAWKKGEGAGREPIWSITWRAVDANEPRILVATHSTTLTVTGPIEDAHRRAKELGKCSVSYVSGVPPTVSLDNRGNVLTVHKAADDSVFMANFASGKPTWCYNDSDMLNEIAADRKEVRVYPSVRVLAGRACILWPNGYVAFFEPNDDEFQAGLDAARKEERDKKIEKMRSEAPEEDGPHGERRPEPSEQQSRPYNSPYSAPIVSSD